MSTYNRTVLVVLIILVLGSLSMIQLHQNGGKFLKAISTQTYLAYTTVQSSVWDDGASPVFSALSRQGAKENSSVLPDLVNVNYAPIMITANMNGVQLQDALVALTLQRQIICNNWEMYGLRTDGGWPVCKAKALLPKKPCTVYSFGIRFDWSFDDAYQQKHGCTLRTFDPSMKNTKEHEHKPGVWFYPFGLSNKKEKTKKGWNMDTYKGFLKRFGEENVTIPYLKFDVDGYEWDVLARMLSDGSLKNVMQLSFEAHTRTRLMRPRFQLLKQLESLGFRRWFYHHRLNGFSFQCDQSFVNINFLNGRE